MTDWGAFEGKVLPLVAKIAGGLKKRILTEEQRARLIEAGKDALKRWRDQRAQAPDSTPNEANSIQGGIGQGRKPRCSLTAGLICPVYERVCL